MQVGFICAIVHAIYRAVNSTIHHPLSTIDNPIAKRRAPL